VRRLVEQDQVFATMMILGTAPNMAIVDYLTEQGVPQLFVATGASAWGSQTEKWPYVMGYQPAYPTEAAIYVNYAAQERPGGKVGILSQNDDFGRDWVFGIKEAIQDTDLQIVAEETYNLTDPTVDSQIVNLSRSGVDVFLNTGQSKQTTQALAKAEELGWDPLHLICSCAASVTAVMKPAGDAASEGTITGQYVKDPADPQWADDPGMQEYKRIIGQYGEGNLNVNDTFLLSGFNYAEAMVKGLENAAEPTRDALMDSVRNFDYQPALLLPGIKVQTSPDDGFPIESLQMSRFTGGSWQRFGDIVDFEGRTPTET
jgi:branched-chain amino acid transport system substrate-binding protein